MHIRYVLSRFPKLSETFVLDQITSVIDAGHNVDIFARIDPEQEQVHPDVERYALLDKVTYADIPKSKPRRLLSAAHLIFANAVNTPQKIRTGLDFRTYGRDALSLQLLHGLLAYPADTMDITHAHFGPNGNLCAILKEAGDIDRLVITFHGSDLDLAENRPRVYEPAFKMADRIIVKSVHNKRRLLGLGASDDDIIVVPLGIDTELFAFQPPADMSSPGEEILVLSVGRLVAVKGHEYGLRAFLETVERNPSVPLRYRIIGGGPREQRLRRLAESLGISDAVEFAGEKTLDVVAEEMCRADIFLHPSVHEGFGRALVEAQASGLPVVTTDVGGIPEAVQPGESALMAPPRTPLALAENLDSLVNNSKRREVMGRQGRGYVEGRFDSSSVTRQLLAVYTGLLED